MVVLAMLGEETQDRSARGVVCDPRRIRRAPGNSRLSSTLERIPFVDSQDFNPNLAGTIQLNPK
jgi:hypothetical protein